MDDYRAAIPDFSPAIPAISSPSFPDFFPVIPAKAGMAGGHIRVKAGIADVVSAARRPLAFQPAARA